MNVCGSGIMHMEGVLLAAYAGCQSMYLLTWTRQLSTYLRSFFHSSACTLCPLSLLFYYIRPSSILNSPRFHAYCYLPSFCFSRASPGLHFFPSLLFSGSFVQCAQLFLQFLTFPIPSRSIIISLNGDVHSMTDGTSCWIHLVKPWICGLSSILHCRKNGPSE